MFYSWTELIVSGAFQGSFALTSPPPPLKKKKSSLGNSSWTSGSMHEKKDLDWRKTISHWEGINIVGDSEKEKEGKEKS